MRIETPEQLKAAREKRGLSRADLASKLGCSPETIKSWEMNRRTIDSITRLALQHFFTCEKH